MSKDSKLEFSQKLIEYNHHTADYYENKKYTFLKVSIAILGFSATFIALFGSEIMLRIGGIGLLTSSMLSLIFFMIFSRPTPAEKYGMGFRTESSLKETFEKTLDLYSKKFSKLKENDIIRENLIQAVILLYYFRRKKRTINIMSFFIVAGLLFFFVAVLISIL